MNGLRAEMITFESCVAKCDRSNECAGFVFTMDPTSKVACSLKTTGMCVDPVPVPRADTVVYVKGEHWETSRNNIFYEVVG